MISVTVNGEDYLIPSSAADTNWAEEQVAFEQALVGYLDDINADADTASTAVATLSAGAMPTDVAGTPGVGTGISAASTNYGRCVVHKLTVAYTAVQTAGTTKDITLWTLPAKTRVERVVADVTTTFVGGAIATCALKVGSTTGGDELLLSGDAFTTATTLGLLQSEWGPNVLGGTAFAGDMSWSSFAVKCRFTSTVANLSALTQGSVTFYIETCTYP